LNAAHASVKALDNANPNSRVGRIATYGKVVTAENTIADPNATEEDKAKARAFLEEQGLADLTAAKAERASLEDAANKTVTDRVMEAVNDMLGL
jgi:beta-glucosidase/6-phospho-beta-glucosidase/beta-galactosidase